MQKLLLFPLLLGSASLAVAAPTPAKPAPAASTPAKPTLEKVNAGELRLDGKITAILGSGSWQLDAISWTSPRGVTTNFDDVKVKAIQVAPNAVVHLRGSTATIPLKDIKLKSQVAVIGKNGPDGTVRVREVILLAASTELKTVGTLSLNPTSSRLIEQSRNARSAGQLPKALQLARQAAETAAGMGDTSGEALCTQDMAILYGQLRQTSNAFESFKRVQALGERLNNPLAQVLGMEGQAKILAATGKTDQATAMLERAFLISTLTSSSLQMDVLSALANVYAAANKNTEAVGALLRLLPLEENSGKYDDVTGTLLTLAALQATSDPAASKERLDQGRQRMGNIRDDAARLGLTIQYARALKATGDAAGATEQFEAAAKLAEAKGDTEGAARIRAMATGNGDETPAPAPDAPDAPGETTAPDGNADAE